MMAGSWPAGQARARGWEAACKLKGLGKAQEPCTPARGTGSTAASLKTAMLANLQPLYLSQCYQAPDSTVLLLLLPPTCSRYCCSRCCQSWCSCCQGSDRE